MEINYLLNDVKNLNDYITATRDVLNRRKNLKVAINIETILTLKKIRSLEIEYLNKCDENGVACIVFEGLLASQPSKVWGVLAKELIYLLQYWLEAIRKHFVNHSTRWWMFLKLILKFIKDIRLKDPAIPNLIVELTAECLFDLATAPKPDVFQRHEILHCINMICAESGREIRFAMRTKFGDYFVKIASHLATSGYLPGQYSSLECLMRWLVPRQERSLRAAAAEKWLPLDLCPATARNIFLNSNWMNFFQDARDFLNALNEGNGLVTSVICRSLSVGEIDIINGTERQQSWIDFNTTGKSISVLLDPRFLEAFGVADHRACETLLIDDEITETALLRRESLGLTISLKTLSAPYIRPTDISTGSSRQVSIVVSSKANLRTLDEAMRKTFGHKYQLHIDLDTEVSQSPQRSYGKNNEMNSEEDTRFSHPVEIKRRKHSGYIVRSKNAGGLVSPSTASTSSLIHLRDRLAALPRYAFDKVPVSVCAEPALSNVSELTERDDRSVVTTKFQPYGVCQRSFKPPIKEETENKSKSEGETVKPKPRSRGGRRILSPVVSDDNCTSLLLVATVGSNSDSVINETVERLSKSKDFQDDNLVNLLIQEALQDKPKSRNVSDSGINTDEKKSQEESEAIDDTPNEIKEIKSRTLKKQITISKSTTDDESNTEAINETPVYVNLRKNTRNYKLNTTVEAEKPTFPVKTIEEFFSQHISENKNRDIVISPTLAKTINETSSETSENFDDNYLFANEDVHTDVEESIFNEIAIIDCLNDMVDKVCSNVNNFSENLSNENIIMATVKDEELTYFKEINDKSSIPKPLEIQKPKRNIKLKNKPVRKPKARVTKKTKKLEQETTKKMSTIIEQKEEDTLLEEINLENIDFVKTLSPEKKTETPRAKDTETSFVRRKRKLYSPKDDDIENEKREFTIDQTSDDAPLSEMKTRNNTKTNATCYKELEKERKKYIRLPRFRKSKAKVIEMPSPRTVKMDSMFDNLKQTVGGNEEITLVDKNTDVYNFSCESDDDDFRKKIKIKKCASTTTVGSSCTVKKSRNIRRAKELDSSYEESNKAVNRKKVSKRSKKRCPKAKIPVVDLVGGKIDLIDERMREAAREELNSSILIEHPTNLEPIEIEPALKEVLRMEEIDDSVSNDTLVSKKNYKKARTERVYGSELNTLSSKKSTKETQMESHCSTSNDTVSIKTAYKRNNKNDDLKQIPSKKNNETLAPKKNVGRRVNKNTELLSIKKEKGSAKVITVYDKEDEGTISPLPGLLVESMPKHNEDNINDLLTTNMLQKFKRLFRDGPDITNDTINTQNMLSDVDRFDYSVQNCFQKEVSFVDDNKENLDAGREKYRKGKKAVQPKTMKCTRNKYKIEPHEKKNIETIDIIDENDYQSEKSIATDGITAHGDFDEEPPNPDKLQEELQPRELQDMDQSMRDYFTKLTGELRNPTKGRETSKSIEDEEVSTILRNETEKTKSVISPIISVKRLSLEDISKWMPSRRTSDTDSPATSSKLTGQTNQVDDQPKFKGDSAQTTPIKNKPPKTSTPESTDSKSPTAPMTRISLAEFDKWLPMPKSFEDRNVSALQKEKSSGDLKLVYRTRSKVKNETEVALPSITKQKAKCINIKKSTIEIAKPIEVETDSNSYNIDSNTRNTRKLRNRAMSTRKAESQNADINNTDEEENVKGTAFKIAKTSKNTTRKKREQMEESNLIDKLAKPSKTSNMDATKPETRITKTVSDSDKSPRRNEKVKPIISPIKLTEDFVSNIEENSSDDEYVKKIRSRFSKTKDKGKTQISHTLKSIESVIEESPVQLKRKSTSPLLSQPKKPKKADEPRVFKEPKSSLFETKKVIEVLEDVIISESGASVSSINDWFKKTRQSDHNASMSYKDTIQNVMEKLDTTLVETNQNTSKKLVNLFVEAQKSLSDQKDEQRKLYRSVARELISDMAKIIEKKFIDLDRKSQEMNNDFMDKLKNQAFALIRDDCKQKRAMVLMLKEDVDAVIRHIESNKSDS